MNYFQEEDTICTITPYHCLWYFDFFLVCDEDLYTAFHLFLQIESENHCTSQMRGLIDEVSIKQSRIVALEGISPSSFLIGTCGILDDHGSWNLLNTIQN